MIKEVNLFLTVTAIHIPMAVEVQAIPTVIRIHMIVLLEVVLVQSILESETQVNQDLEGL